MYGLYTKNRAWYKQYLLKYIAEAAVQGAPFILECVPVTKITLLSWGGIGNKDSLLSQKNQQILQRENV